MSKMYVAKDNLAYDLRLFEAQQSQQITTKPKRLSEVRVKPHGITWKTIAAFVALVAIVVGILAGYAKLTELNTTATSLQKQLNKLKEEEQTLNVAIDKKTNLKSVEQQAKQELSMVQVQDYQIEYVEMERSDKAQILKISPLQQVISKISQGFSSVMEYLS